MFPDCWQNAHLVTHSFLLCTQIHSAVQQVGFRRFKRGYKKPLATPIDPAAAIAAAAKEHRDPTDPYFTYQWYLVSEHTHANGSEQNLETVSPLL
jgi:proprotein convertase subtilisin/kexin type 2